MDVELPSLSEIVNLKSPPKRYTPVYAESEPSSIFASMRSSARRFVRPIIFLCNSDHLWTGYANLNQSSDYLCRILNVVKDHHEAKIHV